MSPAPPQTLTPKQFLRGQYLVPAHAKPQKTKREEVNYFCRTTVTHGFAHIVDKEEIRCLRCFWGFAISILAFASICIVCGAVFNLLDGSLTTEIAEHDGSHLNKGGMRLPDIHICDASIFKASSLAEMGFDNITATYLTLATMLNVENKNVSRDNRDLQTLKKEFDGILQQKSLTMADILNQASLKCVDIIWACSHEGKLYNFTECCDKFFQPQTVVTIYGSCISTHGRNINQSFESRSAGFIVYATPNMENVIDFDENLIKLEYIIQKGIYYAVSSAADGILHVLHTDGRYAVSNAWVSLPISKKVINNTELKSFDNLSGSKCVDPSDEQHRKEKCPEHDHYSTSNCKETLLQKEIMKQHNCSALFLTHGIMLVHNILKNNMESHPAEDIYPLCEPHTILDFMIKFSYSTSCPIECEKEIFHLSPSSAAYSEHYLNRINGLSHPTYQPTVLHFFYPSFKYQEVKNHVKTLNKTFGEIGGALGLLLGFSFISVLEIFALLIRCCHKCFCN